MIVYKFEKRKKVKRERYRWSQCNEIEKFISTWNYRNKEKKRSRIGAIYINEIDINVYIDGEKTRRKSS